MLRSRVTFLAVPTTATGLRFQRPLDPVFLVTCLHIYLTKICANDQLEPDNALQSDDLPGDEGLGDDFSSLSDAQESEGDGLPSSEDEDEDLEDWVDETDLRAARPEIAAGVEADATQEGIGIGPAPALNQAQQAEIEQSQVPNLSVEVEHFGGMAGKPIRTGGPTTSSVYQGNVGKENQPANIYAPFKSQIDWEFAKWAKLRGPTSTAVTDLLNIPGVRIEIS